MLALPSPPKKSKPPRAGVVPENAEGKMVAEALKQSNPDWVGGNHTQAVKLAREVTEAPKLPPLPGLVLNEPGAVRWMRILHAVAAYHNVDVPEILGRSRKRHVIQARFEVFYRLRVDLNFSYTKIAGLMKKDHSTVLHGVNKLRAMILDGCCEEGDDDAPSDTHPSVGTHSPQSVGPSPF